MDYIYKSFCTECLTCYLASKIYFRLRLLFVVSRNDIIVVKREIIFSNLWTMDNFRTMLFCFLYFYNGNSSSCCFWQRGCYTVSKVLILPLTILHRNTVEHILYLFLKVSETFQMNANNSNESRIISCNIKPLSFNKK